MTFGCDPSEWPVLKTGAAVVIFQQYMRPKKKEAMMRALIVLALIPLMACQEQLNEGFSRVAIIEPDASPLSVSYKCDDGPGLSVVFFSSAGTATVAMLGVGQQVLYAQPVASGYHYRNDEFDLRGKDQEVQWNQFGVKETRCVVIGDRI
ncbi:MAG: MliC family protein [Pseudomonadota bacterium]